MKQWLSRIGPGHVLMSGSTLFAALMLWVSGYQMFDIVKKQQVIMWQSSENVNMLIQSFNDQQVQLERLEKELRELRETQKSEKPGA